MKPISPRPRRLQQDESTQPQVEEVTGEEIEVDRNNKEEGVEEGELMMEAAEEDAEKVEEAEVVEVTLLLEEEVEVVLLVEEEALKEGVVEDVVDVDHRKEEEDGDSMVVVKEEVRLGQFRCKSTDVAVHSCLTLQYCRFCSHRNVWRRRWNGSHPKAVQPTQVATYCLGPCS
jgi:hypothetical protein